MNEIVPTFSIITVTYNAAATIEATLLSVRQQTYRHFEHLIIDGASKDNTLYIIYKYKDDTIKVFSEPDKGLYDAMNKGIRAERQFLHMRRHKAPDVLTWKSFQQGMLVCHQAFLVKRTLAEPYNLQYKYSSDFDCCIRMMKKADVISNTHLILIDYLDEGMTTRHHKESLIERLRIMAKHYGWCKTLIMHLWFAIRLLR